MNYAKILFILLILFITIFLVNLLLIMIFSLRGNYDFINLSLIKNTDFYKNKRNDTLKYLQSVYPTSNLEKLSDEDLGKLYNSLSIWYNCAAKFGPINGYFKLKDDGTYEKSTLCWQALPGCGTNWPILPYTPQGWLYDWNSYIQNVSWDFKNNKETKNKVDYTVANQINYSDCSKNVEDMTGSVPGKTFWFWFNGPNPVWMYQRAIFRYNYNPGMGESYATGGENNTQYRYNTPALTPGEISDPNLPFSWNCPKQWWTGVPSGHYLEVTMASEPGLAPSPPICWFDGWRGSGTWVNVGKTIVVRNKVDGVFKLATEAAQTEKGKKQLLSYFGTDNPYQVVKNLVSVDNNGMCVDNSGPIVYDGRRSSNTYKQNIRYNFCNPNTTNQGSIVGITSSAINMNTVNSFYISDWYTWCGDNTTPMPDSCVDKMRLGINYMADRQAAIMTFDEPLFALGTYLGYDSIQMPHSSNGNGRYQYEYLELRGYPDSVKNRDYSSFIMAVEDEFTVVDYRVDFLLDYMPKMEALFSHRDILNPLEGKSIPLVLDADWKDSVRIPKTRKTVKENYTNTTLSNEVKRRKNLNTTTANTDYITLNKNTVYWEDKCPVAKGELGSLWEYNITGKNHISSMFTKLSIAFAPEENLCSPNGLGQSTDVGKYNRVTSKNDWPYA